VTTIDGEEVVVAGGRFERVRVGRGTTRIAVWYPARTKLFDGETGMDRSRLWRIHPADLAAIHAAHPHAFRPVVKRWRDAVFPDHVLKVGRSFVEDASSEGLTRALVVLLFPGHDVNTKDDHDRDPALRSVIKFARRWGWASVEVSYLFSRVAWHADEVRAHPEPIAEGHDEAIVHSARHANLVLAAWGGSILLGKKQPPSVRGRDRRVFDLIKSAGHEKIHCFARDGHTVEFLKYPPHPLNIPRDTTMGVWLPSWVRET
jgi:hypothetical protein